MKTLILCLALFASVYTLELALTQEYIDYLKKHVSYEVQDYEESIFKGWTKQEVSEILASQKAKPIEDVLEEEEDDELFENPTAPPPDKWIQGCVPSVMNLPKFKCTGPIELVDVLSQACCNNYHDYGWLSVQEIISCHPDFCDQGLLLGNIAIYLRDHGLVTAKCFPYVGQPPVPGCPKCPTLCKDKKTPFDQAHVCTFTKHIHITYRSIRGYLYLESAGSASIGVTPGFLAYKSGVFECETTEYLGRQSFLVYGYEGTDNSDLLLYCKNNWGTKWGDKGFFKMRSNSCDLDYEYGFYNYPK